MDADTVAVTYAPGTWAAAAGPGCWLLADAPASDAAVASFVARMAEGLDGPNLLAALADSGLIGLDSFAVVVAGAPGLALVRGAAHVEIADESSDVWTVDADGAATWVEAKLPEHAQTVTLATGIDALTGALSSGQEQLGTEIVTADLLVVDGTPRTEPAAEPLEPEPEFAPELEPEREVEVEGDVGELAAWAGSGTDDESAPDSFGEAVTAADAAEAAGAAGADDPHDAAGAVGVTPVGEFGESGVIDDPPRPSALPPRPPMPPGPPPAAAPDLDVPARPAAPPPPTYAPDLEIDPTPTDLLRLGGRRESVAPVPPTGRPDAAELLPTVLCPLGHASPPGTTTCPRCGSELAEQQPTPLPRPAMGALVLASGETVGVDRGVLVGRTPSWPGAAEDRPHLVQLTSPLGDISRNHLEVTLRGWDVVATDLGSMNGTTVTGTDGGTRELIAGEAAVLADGDRITIADGVDLLYRREP